MIEFSLKLTILAASLLQINGHGMVMDPVNRSSAWKKNFTTPVNWDDSGLFCGGIGVQHYQNEGKCGVCGDDYSFNRPRPNENGGTYGTGTIVKTYKSGQKFTAVVSVVTNHLGKFWFSVCPLSDPKELETEECFEKYPIKLANGSKHFELLPDVQGEIPIELQLPEGLTCQHCVFRWHWKAENNWGDCDDGSEAIGCGPQEHWRNCSDISIEDEGKSSEKHTKEADVEDTTEPAFKKVNAAVEDNTGPGSINVTADVELKDNKLNN